MRTANGNYLVRDGTGNVLSDTLGRTIQYATNKDEAQAAYWKRFTVIGGNGQPQTYQLNYEDGHMVWVPLWGQWMPADDWLLSIDLPDGRSYAFEYNNDRGYLTRMTLPTGATISYDYVCPCGYDYPWSPSRVATRTLSDGQTNQAWNFSLGVGNVTVTDPIGDRVVHLFNYGGLESEARWENSGGTVYRKVLTTWTDEGSSYWGRIRPTPTQIITRQDSWEKRLALQVDSSGLLVSRAESEWTNPNVSAPTVRWEGWYYNSWSWVPSSAPYLYSAMERNPSTGILEEKIRKTFHYDESTLIGTPSNVPNKGLAPDPYHRYNLTSVRSINPQNLGQYVTETFRYDDLGNVREMTNPLGHTTSIDFADNFSDFGNRNSFAYPTSAVNAAGHQNATQYHYDTGLVTRTTNARGLQTTFTYDGLNRPIGAVAPNGMTSAMAYDDVNRYVTETATVGANNHKTESYFDKFYRTFKDVRYDPAGNVQADTVYEGRVSSVSQPYRMGSPVWTTTAYDAADRPVTVMKPDGSVVQYSYPVTDRVTETDEAGNARTTGFTTTGEVAWVYDAILQTSYQHSLFGPLSVYQEGQSRTFTYDWLGRKGSASHPESGTSTYQYDDVGRLTSRTDARGVTAWTSYDAINRPLVTSYSDGTPSVTRAYDQNGYIGFLTTVVDGAGATTFSYNTAGQVASESRTFNGVSGTFITSYGYDVDGKLQTITYPSGRVVAYSYQSSGGLATSRLSSIVDQSMGRTILDSVADNPAGQITSKTLGNGVVETRSFNNRSQNTGIAATQGAWGYLSLSFGYGNPGQNDGRIRSRTDALQPEHSVQYTLDPAGRLTQAVNDSWSISWEYDVWGNRTAQSPAGLATSKVGSQTLGYSNNHNSFFNYDAAGNVVNDTVHNYAYDGESRLVQGDGGAIVYGYDFAGRRVTRTVGSQTTYYIYGLAGLLSEFTTADTGATGWSGNDRTRYIVSEQTGTPVLRIAQNGFVEENNRVFPFGESWLWESGTPNDPQFTSYQRDDESGLDYAIARYYASRMGTLNGADRGPASLTDSQSWNRYLYAGADPINFTDPSGNERQRVDWEWECDALRGNIEGTWMARFGHRYRNGIEWDSGEWILGFECLVPDLVESTTEYYQRNKPNQRQPFEAGSGGGGPVGGVGVGRSPAGPSRVTPPIAPGGPNRVSTPRAVATLNSVGRGFPIVTDPRTGRPIPAPPTGLVRVPISQRVQWGSQERGVFIKEWYQRGFATPEGGWDKYDIHHITPREFGGTNAFQNLVPVLRSTHQQELNAWWRGY